MSVPTGQVYKAGSQSNRGEDMKRGQILSPQLFSHLVRGMKWVKGSSDHVLTEAHAKSTPFFVSIPYAIHSQFVLGFS